MNRRRLTMYFLQSFSVFAYITCLLLWLVALLPLGPLLVDSDAFEAFVPNSHEQIVQPPAPTQPDPVGQVALFVVVAVVVVAMIGFTILSLRKAPRAIGQTGQKVTRRTAEAVIPILAHHHHLPAQKRKKLTVRIAFYIKLAAICVPLVVAWFVPIPDIHQLTRELLVVVTSVLAGWALMLFVLQFVFARVLHVSFDKLW